MGEKVDWSGLIKAGLLGGTVIASSSYLATYLSTKVAAIVWSLPLTLFPTMIFMWLHKTKNSKIGNYAFNSGFGCINLITFCCVVGYLLHFSPLKDNVKNGALYSVLIATGVWCVGALILYYITPFD